MTKPESVGSSLSPNLDAFIEAENAMRNEISMLMDDVLKNPRSYVKNNTKFPLTNIYSKYGIPLDISERQKSPEVERYVDVICGIIRKLVRESGLEPTYGYANRYDNDYIQFKAFEMKESIPLKTTQGVQKGIVGRMKDALKGA